MLMATSSPTVSHLVLCWNREINKNLGINQKGSNIYILLFPIINIFSSVNNGNEVIQKNKESSPQKLRNLETVIEKQMKMIQEQQTIIEKQKSLLERRRKTNQLKVSPCDSLEEFIDREEGDNFDSDEDDIDKVATLLNLQ